MKTKFNKFPDELICPGPEIRLQEIYNQKIRTRQIFSAELNRENEDFFGKRVLFINIYLFLGLE